MMNPLRRRPLRADLAQRRDVRLRTAFARERGSGLRLALVARSVALLLVAVWVVTVGRDRQIIYYLAIIALFAASGVALYWLELGSRRWPKYAFAVVDAALLTATIVLPNPLGPDGLPPAMALRWPGFLYFFLFLAFTVLSLSPLYVLWTGFVLAGWWTIGVLWIVLQPRTIWQMPGDQLARANSPEHIAHYLHPDFVDLTAWYLQVLLLLVVTAILALAVHRARRLVRRQAAAERERGNLARYFSPNVVDALAELDDPLGVERRQDVAVLFADIVGFSAFAERAPPDTVIALLRDHYERLGEIVFAHGGTLDKYMGDALMATFGTPRPAPDDAARALACAVDMLDAMAASNAHRAAAGIDPVRIGIGVDYGPVVLGNIGSERRLEFTVIGDTVNVASRLEALTRELGCDLVASAAVVEAARRSGPVAAALRDAGTITVRGRTTPVPIFTLGGAAATPVALAGD